MSISDFLIKQLIITIPLSIASFWLLFQWLGKKWLEDKFAKNLEEHKAKINVFLSQVSKIHEKEFDVLPEAWRLLQNAIGHVNEMAGLLKYLPDFAKMSDIEIEELLKKENFTEREKSDLLASNNKYDLYQQIQFFRDLNKSSIAVNEFHNYLIYNKIFLGSELFEKFSAIDSLLRRTIFEQKDGREDGDIKLKTKYYLETKDQIDKCVQEIELLIQKYLHYPDAQSYKDKFFS